MWAGAILTLFRAGVEYAAVSITSNTYQGLVFPAPTGAPTVTAGDTYKIIASGGGSGSNTDQAPGSAIPLEGVMVGGEDNSGNFQALQVDSSKNLFVNPGGFTFSTDSISTYAGHGSLTDRSGTLTAGNTQQTLAVANASRHYLLIQNPSAVTLAAASIPSTESIWVNFTTAAVKGQPSIELVPGQGITMEGNFVSTEAISIIALTILHPFTAKEG